VKCIFIGKQKVIYSLNLGKIVEYLVLMLLGEQTSWKPTKAVKLGILLLPCTTMMNNMKSKRERAREKQDTNLCGSGRSTMCLRPQECGYIQ
jgi:hypothetical protein